MFSIFHCFCVSWPLVCCLDIDTWGKFAFFFSIKKPFLSYLLCVLISSFYFINAFWRLFNFVSESYCHGYYFLIEITDRGGLCFSQSEQAESPAAANICYMCVGMHVCVYVCVCLFLCVWCNRNFASCAAKRQHFDLTFGIHEQETLLHVAYDLSWNSKFDLLKEILELGGVIRMLIWINLFILNTMVCDWFL